MAASPCRSPAASSASWPPSWWIRSCSRAPCSLLLLSPLETLTLALAPCPPWPPPSPSNRRRPRPPRSKWTTPSSLPRRAAPPRRFNRPANAAVAAAEAVFPAADRARRGPSRHRRPSPRLAVKLFVLLVSVPSSWTPSCSPSPSLRRCLRMPPSAATGRGRRPCSGDLMVQPAAPPCSSPSPLSPSAAARFQFSLEATNR